MGQRYRVLVDQPMQPRFFLLFAVHLLKHSRSGHTYTSQHTMAAVIPQMGALAVANAETNLLNMEWRFHEWIMVTAQQSGMLRLCWSRRSLHLAIAVNMES